MNERASNSAPPKTPERAVNPFQQGQSGGAVATSGGVQAHVQRAVATIQASYMAARAFPRDEVKCMDKILNEFQRPQLAEKAEYAYARGGSEITGLGIRSAEAIARNWGNFRAGVEEISRREGYSECRAYAVDLQTGTEEERVFQVRHWRDTKKGGYAVTDERDIYELVANMGARRKRACILALIPGDVQEAVLRQVAITLKAKAGDVTPERIRNLLEAFAKHGVTKEQIEKRLQRRIDSIVPAQMLSLGRIFNSLEDEMSTAAEWFETTPADDPPQTTADRAKDILRGQNGAPPASEQQKATSPAPTQSQQSTPAAAQPDPKKAPPSDKKKEPPGDIQADLKRIRATATEQERVDLWKELTKKYGNNMPVDLEAANFEHREALSQKT